METSAVVFLSLLSDIFFLSGWLKVFAVKPGVVGIHGVKSKLYLCMNNDGVAQGKVRYIHMILHHHTSCIMKAIKNVFGKVPLGVGDVAKNIILKCSLS